MRLEKFVLIFSECDRWIPVESYRPERFDDPRDKFSILLLLRSIPDVSEIDVIFSLIFFENPMQNFTGVRLSAERFFESFGLAADQENLIHLTITTCAAFVNLVFLATALTDCPFFFFMIF